MIVKGVTIPSQIRYINYFERALNWGWTGRTIPEVVVLITKIKIYTIPKVGFFGGCSKAKKGLYNLFSSFL